MDSSARLILSVRMVRTSSKMDLSGAVKRDRTPSVEEISR